jgi:diamine N-acetyltransferase
MDNFHIRPATPDDVNLLTALATTTFYEAYFEQDNSSNLSAYIAQSFSPQVIESELADQNSTFFICTKNEKAIGYAKLRENSTVECISEENVIELQRIYILQKMTGKGFGESFLNYCVKNAANRGFQFIWLSVWEHNLPAQSFYIKQGFRRIGEMQYPYGSVITRNFVMIKTVL